MDDEELPYEVQDLSKGIETLKWMCNAQKILPNLPNGMAKDKISAGINSYIASGKTLSSFLQELTNSLDSAIHIIEQILMDCPKMDKAIAKQLSSAPVILTEVREQLKILKNK
jgi:hypothetical protein